MRWIVFDKDGLTAKCEVRSLQYSGEFMGACSITAKVVSPNPVDFEIGDYLLYRGERFEINYDPTVLKQASSGSYGEGFVYDNIVFNSLSDELTRCDFLDYVPNDNNLHYSSLPNFSFFADSVQKLAERIQVNLDRIYTGDKQWTVNVSTEKTGKTDVNVAINNQTCWDALALVKSEFGLNFIVRGRTITIGTEGIAVGKVFSYGKGNGLISVERNAESDQKVITRLRAYGSTKNMPESYYKNVGLQVFGELIWRMFANTFYLNIPYEAKLFTKSSERGKEVVFKVNGEESTGYVTEHTATDEFEGCCELHFDSSELASKLQEGMKVYFTAHVNKTEFPRANKEYAENVPNNMAVRHLMLPSFPTETTDPYIDSENIGELGIREATIFFDGSNGNEEIYPSMEGMTAEDLKAAGVECAAEGALDEVVSAEQIEDDGFFKEGSTIETFKITLKDVGFNINDHLSVSGNATIAFNTGMCGGRDFEIVECKKEGANYVLTCNRHYDESLDLYFPYKDYQIKSGDKFVLINIEMPDVYVQAASQRLLTAAKWYLGNNDYVRYSYVPRIDNIFLAREHDEAVKNGEASIHDTIKEGDLMLFHDTDLGIEGSVIIDTLSIREGESLIPEYEVTLRNNKTVGTITKIQNQIDSIVSGKVGTGGGYNAAQIKSLIDSYGQTLFLSKTKDDRSKGKIASDKAIEVGNYVSGASGAIIYKDAENGQTVAEFDKLYVRMKAYFETLEIINVNTIGGKQIISPAGSVKCIGVEETDNAYRCYFLAEQDGEKVQNRFLVYDQIYSQMFDAVEGTSQNISTHYFWRLCTGKSKEPVTFENKSCHYIDLSKTDCDKDSDVPMVGDVLNQRGNRTDLDRMNFIEMSSVDAFSPNITLFHGVNSYSLDGKAYVSYGVDKSTNKAFMDVYGDMYVGDRQNSSYMRYTQENGLEISGTLSIGTKLGDTPLKDLISASSPEGYQEFVEKVTQEIEGLQAQIDGAIESYFFQYDPTLGNYPASEWIANGTENAHLNDTFTNLASGYSWRWSFDGSAYKWVEITDTATTKALALAGQAKDTADGKRRVFVDTPTPPYDKGDLWSRGSEYPLMICVQTKDKNCVYEASDWDYADNNAKLKEEMQDLVGETKDELNNAIGQAKNEAVNNAKAYTDEGKKALQASIDAMESTKANLDDVYTRAQADGKISETEAKALKAAEEEADAAIAYYDTIVKAYADGVATEEELKEIQGAKAALDAAKKYAEEQAQIAIDEANDAYGYLAKALGTEVDGGLLLTSLIQMRDTDQNIMSGINGLTAKGDKSIATWWGGGMHDMFDYYDWDGAKWVAKKNIQIPSNVPSGVIRMDGTGYLAKGKFWWDESGKIYADPTALFLSFDVEAEAGTLSATIVDIRDKQTEFADMWEFKTDSNGRKYLLSKYPLVTQEGVTMYSGVGTAIPSIYDGLPIDGTTIYWENGVLKAAGGGTGGGGSIDYPLSWSGFSSGSFDGSAAKTIYIPSKLSELTNDSGYALSSALSGYLPLSGGKLTGSVANVLSIDSGDYQDSNGRSAVINFYGGGERGMQIGFTTTTGVYMYKQSGYFLGIDNNNAPYFGASQFHYKLWHEGNLNPSDYLPKSGGTLTGVLTLSSGYDTKLILDNTDNDSKYQYISFRQNGTEYGSLGTSFDDNLLWNQSYILHSKNYSNYALPLTGGEINGNLGFGVDIASANTIGNQTRLPSHIFRNVYDNNGNVYDHYYNESYTASSNTFANLRVKSVNGYYRVLRFGGDGTFAWDGNTLIHSGNYSSYALPLDGSASMKASINWGNKVYISGLSHVTLHIDTPSGYIQLGPQNTSHCHIYTDRDSFYFNKSTLYANGHTIIHSGNIGSQSVSYAATARDVMINYTGNNTNYEVVLTNPKDYGGYGMDALYHSHNKTITFNPSTGVLSADTFSGNATNADKLDGLHLYSPGSGTGGVAYIGGDGVMEVSSIIDFRSNNSDGNDFNTRLYSTGSYKNQVQLPTSSGTLALTTDNVASATKLENNDSYTAWGQTFFINGKPNSLNGTAYFPNGDLIYAKDESGTSQYVLGFTSSLGLGYGSAGAGYDTYVLGNNVYLRYSTSRTIGFSLTSYGNVGIGTTSPSYKLDVSGNIYSSSDIVSYYSFWTNAGREGCYLHGTGISWHNSSNSWTHDLFTYSSATDMLTTHRVLGCLSSIFMNQSGDGIYLYNTGISWHNSANAYVSSLINFDSNSIALYQPTYITNTLSVTGTITATDKFILSKSLTGGTSGIQMDCDMDNGVRRSYIVLDPTHPFASGLDYVSISTYSDGRAYFDIPHSGTLLIAGTIHANHGGNVGIGTTAPAYMLDVNGQIRANGWVRSNNGVYIDGGVHYTNIGGYAEISSNGNEIIIGGTTSDMYVNYRTSSITGNAAQNWIWCGGTGSSRANFSIGDLLCSGGITMYSDQRKKTILNHVELSLKDIANAPLIEHYYNSDDKKTTHVGSIAQYWASMNDWFCKLDSEGFYTMEIQNCALASAISIARELDKYESETDRRIANLERENALLKEEIRNLKSA